MSMTHYTDKAADLRTWRKASNISKIEIKRAANKGQNYCAYKGNDIFATIHGDKPNIANNRQAHWSLCYLTGRVEWFDSLAEAKYYALKG